MTKLPSQRYPSLDSHRASLLKAEKVKTGGWVRRKRRRKRRREGVRAS